MEKELPSFSEDVQILANQGRSMLVQPGKGTLTNDAGLAVGAKEVDGKVKHVVQVMEQKIDKKMDMKVERVGKVMGGGLQSRDDQN